MGVLASVFLLKGEGRLPRWKDGLTRSFAHGSTPSRLEERRKGAKRSGVGNPGAMTSRCSADEAPGHLVCVSSVGRCSGVSIRVAHRISACERTSSTDEWKLLEQGPEVSLLLWFAQVECRLSSAPPISMHLLCAGWAGLPIRVKAHCPCGPTHRKFERRARCGTARTGRQTLRT